MSYADDLLGQAIAALKDGGAAEDTVVSFIGDHGWALGEKCMYVRTFVRSFVRSFERGISECFADGLLSLAALQHLRTNVVCTYMYVRVDVTGGVK